MLTIKDLKFKHVYLIFIEFLKSSFWESEKKNAFAVQKSLKCLAPKLVFVVLSGGGKFQKG